MQWLKKFLFSFLKKLNKNKGLILGSYKSISSVIFPAQALSYRFNGYNLSQPSCFWASFRQAPLIFEGKGTKKTGNDQMFWYMLTFDILSINVRDKSLNMQKKYIFIWKLTDYLYICRRLSEDEEGAGSPLLLFLTVCIWLKRTW